MPIQYDKTAIGRSAQLDTIEVTEEMIRKYANAIGAEAPDDPAELVAGPMFCNVITRGQGSPEVEVSGHRRGFMAGQSYEPLGPIRPGDKLTITATVADIYEKTGRSGNMLFVVREQAFRNQNDEVVAKIRFSAVLQE